jgi:hypothetical protein
MTTKRKSEVDPKAAPCIDIDDELRQVMRQNLRAPRTKPTTAVAVKPTRRGKSKSKQVTKSVKPAVLENKAPTEGFSLKGQLTLKEQRFMELYLIGDLTVDKVMESAGYVGHHPNSLYRLGRKIVQKHESQAAGHREIFRSIGAGEIAVAQGLLKLATTARSEMVRLNAWATIAKCMGLQRETVDTATGISIVINTGQQAATEPGPGGGRPGLIQHEQHREVPRAITITK